MKVLAEDIKNLLHKGTVIPAHPLALTADRQLDEKHQRLLTKYYLAAGVGGIAIGVHTTQFQIRDPKINLYEKVLTLAVEEIEKADLERPIIKIAGVSGNTEQALNETRLCAQLGYDLVLVSNNGMGDWSEEALLDRTRQIAEIMPVFGFYLQPSVGGRVLSYQFWEQFAAIENVHAIKIAPFNRYQTLDVVRAVCNAPRCHDIALYTGNDDNIVADLLTTYQIFVDGKIVVKTIVGGLLGHWAVWTEKAVELFDKVQNDRQNLTTIPAVLMSLNISVTDANAAFFDAANNFKGCIAGLHEVLRRQGLLKGLWCLDENETLSPGQLEEINRVYQDYPFLNDDAFVAAHLETWISEL